MVSLTQLYGNKRVLVTGHTGFKGSWLCEWLLGMEAQVHGFALPPSTRPALFEQLQLENRISRHQLGDVRNLSELLNYVQEVQPEFVFHLAAQPLVRLSYQEPVETYATNVMGTVNLLESLRLLRKPCSVVVVTTDKCYENKEWTHAYREEDPMGGHDPYSSSKGAAELVVSAYRRSFFSSERHVKLASARAGNVIGGGDWATDRIVPDCIRALQVSLAIPVRNKVATRPWQHVLEPLSGYLQLGAALHGAQGGVLCPESYCTGFNFGPSLSSNRTVLDLVQEILKHQNGNWIDASDPHAPHEAGRLNLAIDKAFHLLGWQPRWDFSRTVEKTVAWYQAAASLKSPDQFQELTRQQINEYLEA
jgi:CDP-glucose 4,6-dehydratase